MYNKFKLIIQGFRLILKVITFLSILVTIFFLIYRNSNNKGLKRFKVSFKIAIVVAASLASLSVEGTKATKPSVSNSQVGHERLVSNQEFNSLEENDWQVILVKNDGNPITSPTNRGPSNFPTPPSGGRPSQPVYVPKYRTAPKIVNPGLGAGANPAGAGGGGGNDNFDDNRPVQKNKQTKNLKTSGYDYIFNNKKKKTKSAESCELDENGKVKKTEIVDRIKEDPGLIRAAEKTLSDKDAERDIIHLIKQLSLGNKSPGTGSKALKGVKDVREARVKNGGRVYFREKNGKIEILAISHKNNQKKLIDLLKKIVY